MPLDPKQITRPPMSRSTVMDASVFGQGALPDMNAMEATRQSNRLECLKLALQYPRQPGEVESPRHRAAAFWEFVETGKVNKEIDNE